MEPLIYTTKGNLPIAYLEYKYYREDVPGKVVLVEEYLLAGESVKRSVHVCPLVGVCLEGTVGAVGG